ncbi:Smr/MutS family protein [uncultured Abyssibacter sp.]|uniref:Smr/MutS family protein n=1 Tax=uncultured Abyssibacter sp. TaxID=2320202 RepID=UPI0032B2201C
MGRTTDSDDDDRALLESAYGGVQPLSRTDRERPHRTAPDDTPRQSELDRQAVLRESLEADPDSHEESGEGLLYRANGLSESDFRKLRRGAFTLQSSIDLHGLNREQARLALAEFLAESADRGYRCVKVIHGKGLGSSAAGPVIKPAVARWLRRRQDVLGYASAKPQEGGSGATVVLLRKPR